MRTAVLVAVLVLLVTAAAAQAGGQDRTDQPDTSPNRAEQPDQSPDQHQATFDRIAAGETVDVGVDRAKQIGISRVSISVTNPARNVTVKIRPQQEQPAEVEQNVSGIPYRYMEITASNLSDNDITRAEIAFTVNTTWLDNHDASPDAAQLARYTNESWDALPTSIERTADRNVTYTAETPGFSFFVVFTRGEEPEEIRCGNGICQTNQTWETCSSDCEKPQRVVDAEQAIAAAEHRINPGDDGYNLLQEARAAYDAGNYGQATTMAEQAVDMYRTPDRDLIRLLIPVLLPFAVLLLAAIWKRDELADRWSEDSRSSV